MLILSKLVPILPLSSSRFAVNVVWAVQDLLWNSAAVQFGFHRISEKPARRTCEIRMGSRKERRKSTQFFEPSSTHTDMVAISRKVLRFLGKRVSCFACERKFVC